MRRRRKRWCGIDGEAFSERSNICLPTDVRTDGQTDGQPDKPSCKDAWTHLEIKLKNKTNKFQWEQRCVPIVDWG